MKVCIMGGTGPLGSGIAVRLAAKHEVIIGSRDLVKAKATAEKLGSGTVSGALTQDAASGCEAAVVAVPFDGVGQLLPGLRSSLSGKLVVSAVVPMTKLGGYFAYSLQEGSAAQRVAAALPESKVASAFHTVPAAALSGGGPLQLDVPVTADGRVLFEQAAALVASIEGLRPIHAGPLSSSAEVERLTPLLLNIWKLNGMPSPSLRFVSTKEPKAAKG